MPVLSAMAHGNGPEGIAVVEAAFLALGRLGREHGAVYFQIIWNAIREPMRRALEALVMERQTEGKALFPPFAEALIERGAREGELRGKLEGIGEGKLEGIREGKSDALLRLLTRGRRPRLMRPIKALLAEVADPGIEGGRRDAQSEDRLMAASAPAVATTRRSA
jgi:hypothetical protein